MGGGILVNKGALRLYNSVIRKNRASNWGAGVAAMSSTAVIEGVLVEDNVNTQVGYCGGGVTSAGGGVAIAGSQWARIMYSTFKGNKACRGAGLVVQIDAPGEVRIDHSTFSGNQADMRGGGLLLQAGTGRVSLKMSTITENKAGLGGYVSTERRYGGGIGLWGFDGTLWLQGNIIAKNQTVNSDIAELRYDGHDCFSQPTTSSAFEVTSRHKNFIGILDNCTALGVPGDPLIGAASNPRDPRLQPLGHFGWWTWGRGAWLPVHKPYSNSPVIGKFTAAANVTVPNLDQRGYTRPSSPERCDVGSVEYVGALPP
jgi:hypothetical protein